jgi:carboxyl-terminal processing protease
LISKSKYAALLLSSVLVVYAIVGGKGRVSAQNGTLQQLDVFAQVFQKISDDYVDQPSMNIAIAGAIRGLLEQVDPYSGYLNSQEAAFYKDFSIEKTPGIGVVLGRANGFPTIVSVVPGSSGAKAGLKSWDTIEAIDGVPTREMNLVQAYRILSAPADQPATLTLIGNGRRDPETVKVAREVVKIPAAEVRLIQNDIAYVRVPFLAQGKSTEVRKQLNDLLTKGATGVLLDLRSSGGGKEAEGYALANLFIDSGSLGYRQGQKVPKQVFQADPKLALTKAPLVVLVDGGTGGPSELAAAALSDNKRGRLVGSRTFGTGFFQTLIPMEGGNALLISTAKYYSPLDKDILEAGVAPDTRVPETRDPNSPQTLEALPQSDKRSVEEMQMDRAIQILKEVRSAARKAA